MIFLIDIVFNVLTTVIPLILSIKVLDTRIEFRFATYQFLLNYWLYYVLLQYIQYQFLNTKLISMLLSSIKLWLFYGTSNNLYLVNNFLVTRGFQDYENFKSYETRIVNPLFNRIAPSFNSMSIYLNKLGKRYLQPIDESESNSIDFYIWNIFHLLNYILSGSKEQIEKTSPKHKRSSSSLDSIIRKSRSRSSSVKSNKSNKSRVPTPKPINERYESTQSPTPYPMNEFAEMPRSVSDSLSKKTSSLGRRTKSNGDCELEASIRKFRQQQFEQQVNYQQQQSYVKIDGIKLDSNSLRAVQEYLNGDSLPEMPLPRR